MRAERCSFALAAGACSGEVVQLDEPDALSFDIRYVFESADALAAYLSDAAPALREKTLAAFPPDAAGLPGGITFARSTGKTVFFST